MMNERLAELMSRKLSGEATSAELQELHGLLMSHPGDQYFSEILLTYWNNPKEQGPQVDQGDDQHFAHILEMAGEIQSPEAVEEAVVNPGSGRLRLLKKIAIAAGILGVIATGAWMLTPVTKSQNSIAAGQPKISEVVAGKGIRSKMVLPDGTQVWLNSDSKLSYNEAFDGELREVTLEGEAYFDVMRNPERPFIVHTSAVDIRVLGTAFNVKSYPLEKTIETTLIHGLVEVINRNRPESSKIILRPKEKLVFNKADNVTKTDPTTTNGQQSPDVINSNAANNGAAISITALPRDKEENFLAETSWVYNRLIFEGDSFSDLATKMERWFNVKIRISNEKLASHRLSGSFEDENILQALQALQYIAKFNYNINTRTNEVEITE